jgi:hypothetical protein
VRAGSALVVLAGLLAGAVPAGATVPPPARHRGDLSGLPLNAPIVAMEATPNGRGYWLLASDGGVFAFGNARFFGSTGAMPLNAPIVAMAPTYTGRGYWLVASDGGVFAFGDATFHGSRGASPPPSGVVGIAATNTGDGYWIASARGEVWAFGDAAFHGDVAHIPLNAPVIDIVTAPFGAGYYLLAADGGVFAFGDAAFHGSTGALRLVQPVTAMVPFPFGYGYWLVAADGGIFTFGRGSGFFGSWAASPPAGRVVAGAAALDGRGYWLVTSGGRVRAFSGAPMQPRGAHGLTPRRLPSRQAPLRVLALGDSMMISLQAGLAGALASTREAIGIQWGKWSYGWTSAWRAGGSCLFCEPLRAFAPPSLSAHVRYDNFDAAVLMLGGWDQFPRFVDGRWLEPFTPEWDRWYRRLQNDAMRRLTAEGAVVFWVGHPRCGRTDPALAAFDLLAAAAAARHDDAVFLDLHARVCPTGVQRNLTLDGRPITLLDGTGHFTADGARWVGEWVTRKMRSTFDLPRPA